MDFKQFKANSDKMVGELGGLVEGTLRSKGGLICCGELSSWEKMQRAHREWMVTKDRKQAKKKRMMWCKMMENAFKDRVDSCIENNDYQQAKVRVSDVADVSHSSSS